MQKKEEEKHVIMTRGKTVELQGPTRTKQTMNV